MKTDAQRNWVVDLFLFSSFGSVEILSTASPQGPEEDFSSFSLTLAEAQARFEQLSSLNPEAARQLLQALGERQRCVVTVATSEDRMAALGLLKR